MRKVILNKLSPREHAEMGWLRQWIKRKNYLKTIEFCAG